MRNRSDSKTSFTALGSTKIGRDGEKRVAAIVTKLLETKGHQVRQRPSDDARGEDARLAIGNAAYTLQATTIPDASDFWRESKTHGSATTQVTPQQAAAWLATSLENKVNATPPAQRADTILALDAHDWGEYLAHPTIVTHLQQSGLNPAQRYGLAAVVIAGKTTSDSTWLGGTIV